MTDDLRDLVVGIYDTIADASRWPKVLDRISKGLDARGCIIFEMNGLGAERQIAAPYYSSVYEAALLEDYLRHFSETEMADQDIFEARSLASDGIDLIDDDVLAASDEELFARPNTQQLLKYGIRHRAAGVLDKDNKFRGRFSVQLGTEQGRLTPDQRAYLDQVLPHVAKALDLGRPAVDLASAHRGLIAAMDRLRIGVCILDGLGRVIVSNEEFERQREAYGTFRADRDGRLQLHDGVDRRRFSELLKDQLSHGQHGARPRKEAISTDRDDAASALCIELAPLDHVDEMGSGGIGGAILYSLDTSLPIAFDPTMVRQIFGLTTTEAELTRLVSEGMTNAQIAERRERSVETINAQVKAVLGKTQCTNRTQLVRLLTSFGSSFLKTPA